MGSCKKQKPKDSLRFLETSGILLASINVFMQDLPSQKYNKSF